MTNLIEVRAQRESLDKLLTFRAILAGWSQLIGKDNARFSALSTSRS